MSQPGKDHAFRQLENRLEESESILRNQCYIHRYLYLAGTEPRTAGVSRRLGLRSTSLDCLGDDNLESVPYTVITGDAGTGKTLVLRFAFTRHGRTAMEHRTETFPILLDLETDLGTSGDLDEALTCEYPSIWPLSQASVSDGVALFIDGIEHPLALDTRFMRDLGWFIKRNASSLRQVVITCRRAVWRDEWLRDLPPDFKVYTADHLDFECYSHLIPDKERLQVFFNMCKALSVEMLLDRAFDGFYLARRFVSGFELPRTRFALIDQRVQDSLSLRLGQGSLHSGQRLRTLACSLAFVSTFTSENSWETRRALDLVTMDPKVGQASGDEVEQLLESPLFRRSGNRFAFSHQLFVEFLCAERMADLSLRSQCLLLESQGPRRKAIRPSLYGVASLLMGFSERFGNHLTASEPHVALQSDTGLGTRQDQAERVITRFIEESISASLPPWYDVNQWGDTAYSLLRRHRPTDIPVFLALYLEGPSSLRTLWGTACISAWGGNLATNSCLERIALDRTRNSEEREYAVEGISATGDRASLLRLVQLFEDQEDAIRGEILKSYRVNHVLPTHEIVTKLGHGPNQANLICDLQVEASRICDNASEEDWEHLQESVADVFPSLGSLKDNVLESLIRRGDQLGRSVSERVLEAYVCHDSHDADLQSAVITHVRRHVPLQKNLLEWILRIAESSVLLLPPTATDVLVGSAGEKLLEWLQEAAGNPKASGLVGLLVRRVFDLNPTEEVLSKLKYEFPSFCLDLRLPEAAACTQRDWLADMGAFADALGETDHQVGALKALISLSHMAGLEKTCWCSPGEKEVRALIEAFARVRKILRFRLLDLFEKAIYCTEFERSTDENSIITLADPRLEAVYFICVKNGRRFSLDKTIQVIRCYAFFPSEISSLYYEILDEVRSKDAAAWGKLLLDLCKDPIVGPWHPLTYLTARGSTVLSQYCLDALTSTKFRDNDLPVMIDYLMKMHPDGINTALENVYRHLSMKGDCGCERALKPLWLLLSLNSAWGWSELELAIENGQAPVSDDMDETHKYALKPTDEQARILANWLAFVEKRAHDRFRSLSHVILQTIKEMNTQSAIDELGRLKREHAFPGSDWLAFSILDMERKLLDSETLVWDASSLLAFAADRGVMALSNRGLFEAVCEVVERIKDSCEHDRLLVSAFWNGDTPKPEPECQDILWHFIGEKLRAYRNAAVDCHEKQIGPYCCDYWVEKSVPNSESWTVALELKSARKGYGQGELIDPVERQLWTRYMQLTCTAFGLVVVLWFKDSDRYPWPTRWESRADLGAELNAECSRVARLHSCTIGSYVIDVSAPFRRH